MTIQQLRLIGYKLQKGLSFLALVGITSFIPSLLSGYSGRESGNQSARAFHVLTLLRPPVSFHLQTPTTQATFKIELDQGHTLFLML